jgi:hypothetical protein
MSFHEPLRSLFIFCGEQNITRPGLTAVKHRRIIRNLLEQWAIFCTSKVLVLREVASPPFVLHTGIEETSLARNFEYCTHGFWRNDNCYVQCYDRKIAGFGGDGLVTFEQ